MAHHIAHQISTQQSEWFKIAELAACPYTQLFAHQIEHQEFVLNQEKD